MGKHCVFAFFMIFNTIFGIAGLAVLGTGIYLIVESTYNYYQIIIMAVGAFVTIIFIVGACSWKRDGALIGYFVLVLIVTIALTVISLLMKFNDSTNKFIINHITTIVNDTPISDKAKQAIIDYSFYALVSAAGLGFLSFVFSCIYFCMLTRKDSQIYTEVNKMGYSSLTHDI